MEINDVLTVDNVLRVMDDLVKEYGENYTYKDRVMAIRGWYKDDGGCEYTVDEQPACIVGMVFDRLGVLDEILQGHPKHGWDTPVDKLLDPNKTVTKVLSEAQMAQDRGAPWGWAYTRAKYTATALGHTSV